MEIVMLEHYYAKPSTIDRIRDSWLGSQIESYVGWMEANGYSSRTIFRRMPRLFSFAEFAHKRGCTDIASASSLVDEFVSEWPFADELGIPKLNFEVLRRTMATRAQNLGSVKDIQSHLRHSRADTTVNEYMQELPKVCSRWLGRFTRCSRRPQRGSMQGRFEPV